MKQKKVTFFLLLLTVLCGCTTQPSNDTNNMLETKTYLYSYDYETEPNGELSTASVSDGIKGYRKPVGIYKEVS